MDAECTPQQVAVTNEKEGGRQKAFVLAVCLAIAFVCITVVSRCSFLYRFNDWSDVNWFLSMGHGIVDGKVPYKDLFEQKGVLIYMLFALAYLIDSGGYLGVYLIEILFACAYLFAAYHIIRLYKSRLFSMLALVPVALFTYCCAAFAMGGGAVEEFCLPQLAFGLYVFLSYIKRGGDKIPLWQVIVSGLISGCIFWIKYTMLAFYGAFAVLVFVDRCIKKDVKSGFLYAALFIAGFVAASIPWIIYLAANKAVSELWQVYFIDNIFGYAGSKSVAQVAHNFGNTVVNLLKNIFIYILALFAMGYIVSLKGVAKRFKVYHIAIFAVLFFIQCILYGSHLYYHLAVAVYVPLGIAGADRCACGLFAAVKASHSKRRAKRAVKKGGRYIGVTFNTAYARYGYKCDVAAQKVGGLFCRVKARFVTVCAAAFLLLLLLCGNCTLEIFYSKSYYPQLSIAERIEEDAGDNDYTLLCYKIRDGGFYTACDKSPDYYYFALNNFTREAFPELYDGQESYVINKEATYVITDYSVWEEEKDGNLSGYGQLDEGKVYSYTHHESNFQTEQKEYVLLVVKA